MAEEDFFPFPTFPEEVQQPPTLEEQINDLIPLSQRRENQDYFEYLREISHTISFRQTLLRIAQNPELTREEYTLGMFEEMLEPQVRKAVLSLRRKGFQTLGSGFGGESHQKQYIRFRGPCLSQRIIDSLEQEGVQIEIRDEILEISFYPKEGESLENIKNRWLKVISFLPDTGGKLPPAWQLKGGFTTGYGDFVTIFNIGNLRRRKEELFDFVEKESDIELIFSRYWDKRRRLRRLILG